MGRAFENSVTVQPGGETLKGQGKDLYESVHALIQCPGCSAASPMTRTHGPRSQGSAQGSGNFQHALDHRKSKRVPENISFCTTDSTKDFVWITTNHGKFLEMGIPEHFTCILRNQYAGQEETVRTRHGTMDWFQTGKGVL